jgi:hypothetical protein
MTVSQLPSFHDVSPYLERIQDRSLSLKVARWLTEHLKVEQDKTKSWEAAIFMATQIREQAKTEVLLHVCVSFGEVSVNHTTIIIVPHLGHFSALHSQFSLACF